MQRVCCTWIREGFSTAETSVHGARGIDGEPTDQLADVQEAANALEQGGGTLVATGQDCCDQWPTASVHRNSPRRHRCMTPRFFTVSLNYVSPLKRRCFFGFAAGAPTSCYRRAPRSSTTNWRTCSAAGTSGSGHKPPDPRLLDALPDVMAEPDLTCFALASCLSRLPRFCTKSEEEPIFSRAALRELRKTPVSRLRSVLKRDRSDQLFRGPRQRPVEVRPERFPAMFSAWNYGRSEYYCYKLSYLFLWQMAKAKTCQWDRR